MDKQKDDNNSFVNLNYICNNNCISCIMENHHTSGYIPLKIVKKRINQLLRRFNHIEFNGGEPTLDNNLFKVLKYTVLLKPNVEIGLITNSRMFSNMSYIHKIKKLNLNNFKIVTSIYGHDSDLHDAITRTPKSFEQQIKGIKNLIENKIQLELRVIINKLNYKNLDLIAKFISQNFSCDSISRISLVNMKITGSALRNKMFVTYKTCDAVPYLCKSVTRLVDSGFNVKLLHFPLCTLPNKLRVYARGITAEMSEIEFLSSCKKCVNKKECCGIWKSYLNVFGGEEFKPYE